MIARGDEDDPWPVASPKNSYQGRTLPEKLVF
jgi:hypothetical protein